MGKAKSAQDRFQSTGIPFLHDPLATGVARGTRDERAATLDVNEEQQVEIDQPSRGHTADRDKVAGLAVCEGVLLHW